MSLSDAETVNGHSGHSEGNGLNNNRPYVPTSGMSATAANRFSQQSYPSTAFRGSRVSQRYGRRLRSQYPDNPNKSHVEFILVASFDIHRGSVMEHQYPGEISSDEHMLAELMLPDQAHSRAQDWTIFFLHKDSTGEDEQADEGSPRRKGRRKKQGLNGEHGQLSQDGVAYGTDMDYGSSEDEDDDDEAEGPPLIYVLNLVSTKYDNTATRLVLQFGEVVCH